MREYTDDEKDTWREAQNDPMDAYRKPIPSVIQQKPPLNVDAFVIRNAERKAHGACGNSEFRCITHSDCTKDIDALIAELRYRTAAADAYRNMATAYARSCCIGSKHEFGDDVSCVRHQAWNLGEERADGRIAASTLANLDQQASIRTVADMQYDALAPEDQRFIARHAMTLIEARGRDPESALNALRTEHQRLFDSWIIK